MRDDGRDDPMVVSTRIQTVLEAEDLRVMVEYRVREGGVDDWKVTVSADWEGRRVSESDLVDFAILSLFEARLKLFFGSHAAPMAPIQAQDDRSLFTIGFLGS